MAAKRTVKAAGIIKRGIQIHALRHCCATHLLEAGVNVYAIEHRFPTCSRHGIFQLYVHRNAAIRRRSQRRLQYRRMETDGGRYGETRGPGAEFVMYCLLLHALYRSVHASSGETGT